MTPSLGGTKRGIQRKIRQPIILINISALFSALVLFANIDFISLFSEYKRSGCNRVKTNCIIKCTKMFVLCSFF